MGTGCFQDVGDQGGGHHMLGLESTTEKQSFQYNQK